MSPQRLKKFRAFMCVVCLMQPTMHSMKRFKLVKEPTMSPRKINYFHSRYIQMWVDRPVRRGGGTVFKTDKDVVTFRGENFVFRSDASGFRPPVAGRYRVRIKAAAHQPRSSDHPEFEATE